MSPFNEKLTLRHEIRALTNQERVLYGFIFIALISFVYWDISADIAQENSLLHITVDLCFGATSCLAVLLLAARTGRLRILSRAWMEKTANESAVVSAEASEWKLRAEQLQAGVSEEIDRRMSEWKLSEAEKEIGLLLMKGLSIREIGDVRGTSERTVRQQSLSIYAKAEVAGRAELSAYFMEDFLDRKESHTPH